MPPPFTQRYCNNNASPGASGRDIRAIEK